MGALGDIADGRGFQDDDPVGARPISLFWRMRVTRWS